MGRAGERAVRVMARDGGLGMVVVLPAAGAGASSFRSWSQAIPPGLGVAVIKPPGREERIAEPLLDHVDAYADQVVAALEAMVPEGCGTPYALFGHSLGGLVAGEVARRPSVRPAYLAIAGTVPPDAPMAVPSDLGDDALVEFLVRLGGTPREVLDHPELLELVLRALRADLTMMASCRASWQAKGPIDLPMLIIAGSDDVLAPPDRCRRWSAWTTGPASFHAVDGGHFFATMKPESVLRLLVTGFSRAGAVSERENGSSAVRAVDP